MYLARVKDRLKTRYVIRESVQKGRRWMSRDLMDLGRDPRAFIVYPGGNAFYVAMEVADTIEEMGAEADGDDIEALFWPFVDPQLRRKLDHFHTRSENAREARMRKEAQGASAPLPHLFDRRRVHYLRYGQTDQSGIDRVSAALYRFLANKSRDEIEHHFLASECVLKPHEWKRYVFVIFDLQRHFKHNFARTIPEGLDPGEMDARFLDDLCALSEEASFWDGMAPSDGLRDHLVRYLIMYFDSDFPMPDMAARAYDAFRRRHQQYRPPQSVLVSMEMAARLFATNQRELRQMSRSDLARLYRTRAKSFHPDQGGSKAEFIQLTEAYHKLLRTKR
ncbi:MAG: J domain-containing protein [Desulfobacterales bacterium]|jgi:hypothetical protein